MQTCLICDDHAMMRNALAGSVAMNWPDAEISLAGDFQAAWHAAGAGPDLILCDLGMPGALPLAGIAGMRQHAPNSRLVVITASEEDDLLLALFELGIVGFVPKTSSPEVIEAAIRLVLAGGRFIPQRVIELASERGNSGLALDPELVARELAGRLSERQLQVLRLIAAGESNKEIARELGLSPSTAKAHAAAAMTALGTTNRAETAFKARELGLI